MRLFYSDKKVPYILFENGSRLIFSVSTENEDKGFKYLAFNGETMDTITVSGAKAKKERTYTIVEQVTFITNMDIKRPGMDSLPRDAKDAGLSKITASFLRKTFKTLVDEDGYFPRANLPTLEKILEKVNGHESDTWDHDPSITEEEEI